MAITTSIPEISGSQRNWDYRYCWLRDSYFAIHALNRLGETNTMEGYLRFLDHVVDRSANGVLQPLYTITGEIGTEERLVGSLAGYRGMGPVRVGNLAHVQIQNDVYGAVVLAARQLFFDQRLNERGDAAAFARLEALGERAFSRFALPDAGPWEIRGGETVHTFSAVMCWAGCERLARIAAQLKIDARAAFWRSRAEAMRGEILARAWSEAKQAFAPAASAVRRTGRNLAAATGSRVAGSRRSALRHHTRRDRARAASAAIWCTVTFTRTTLECPPDAFAMCSFWYVHALAGVGRVSQAREVFESLLRRRNRFGLLSEDIDPATGEQWGNFPQTYSMVGVITSALRLSRSWEAML